MRQVLLDSDSQNLSMSVIQNINMNEVYIIAGLRELCDAWFDTLIACSVLQVNLN